MVKNTGKEKPKIKGRAIVIKGDEKPPGAGGVQAMQVLARRVSSNLFAMLEAEKDTTIKEREI